MKNKHKIFLIYPVFRILFFLFLFLLFAQNQAQARDIYVRLSAPSGKFSLSSTGNMTITDAAKKNHTLGKTVTLTRSGAFAVNGKNKYSLPIRISSGGLLSFNGRKYRGVFLLTKNFTLIDTLDVEDYLRGVLPAEAGSSQSEEYLKAHAISSRTFAIKKSLGRGTRGYDVTDGTADQVYKGAGVETGATDKAVRATTGEVLTYEGDLASTFFHSDSGGHTASVAQVWGQDIPYLRGVKEPVSYNSPNSNWTAKISSAQVQTALSKLKATVGAVREIRVSETDRGGRAAMLTFVGSGGSASVKAGDFRMAVGPDTLKSTMLTTGAVSPNPSQAPTIDKPAVPNIPALSRKGAPPARPPVNTPAPPVPTSDVPLSEKEEDRLSQMTRDGVFSAAELMDMLKNPKKLKGYFYLGLQRSGRVSAETKRPKVEMPNVSKGDDFKGRVGEAVLVPDSAGNFTFHGKGWGHGVGLSQWGAKTLSEQGWTAERILEHYYNGAVVKKFK
ncbi:stage II sporulation protein SpoIID [Synergistales bacterium]|nr:stage II sporulation protein SpoIID [Synergistales bacterium]